MKVTVLNEQIRHLRNDRPDDEQLIDIMENLIIMFVKYGICPRMIINWFDNDCKFAFEWNARFENYWLAINRNAIIFFILNDNGGDTELYRTNYDNTNDLVDNFYH